MSDMLEKIKITSPERIRRLCLRACSARLPLFLRDPEKPGILVKAIAEDVMLMKRADQQTAPIGLHLSGLSIKAGLHLKGSAELEAHFVLMSSKIMFKTHLLSVNGAEVKVAFPEVLISFERRKNARFETKDNLKGFVSLLFDHPQKTPDLLIPHLFSFPDTAVMLPVFNISVGGVGVETIFPGFVPYLLENKQEPLTTKMHLPMQMTVRCPMVMRWYKKLILEPQAHNPQQQEKRIVYRFGFSFDLKEDDLFGVKKFIQLLVKEEAI